MKDDRLRLWRVFIWGRSVVTGVLLVLLVVINSISPSLSLRPLFYLAGVQFATNGVYLFLWKRRDIAFLGYLSFGLEIVLITLLIYFLGPDGYAFVLAGLWPIIMGGWLSGRQAIPLLTSLSGIGYLLMVLLERRGLIFAERIIMPDGTPLALILSLPYLAFLSLLVWLLTREVESGEQNLRLRNQELNRLNAKLCALVAAGEELLGCRDLRQLLSFSLAQIEKLTGHRSAAIYLKQGNALRLSQQRGLPPALESQGTQLPFPRERTRTVGLQKEEVATLQEPVEAKASELPADALQSEPGLLTHIALRSPRDLEGILTIVSSDTESLDQSDSQPLTIFGHQLGIALENVRLFDNLQHERNLLRGILAHMGEGVFVANQEGHVLLANRAAAHLLGIHEDQPLPDWFSSQVVAPIEEGHTDGFQFVEFEDKTVSVSMAQLPGTGKTSASTIYVARDVTQQAQVERMKSDFVAYASHELRTPLTTIKMLVGLLLMDTPPDCQQQEYLSIIRTQVDRQARLVNNLLDCTRLEAGQYELPPERVDPRQVIRTALAVCRPLAEEKGLGIEISISRGPNSLVSNSGGLEQVIINLLSNAIKFTPKGGQVSVSCSTDQDEVLFVVQDTGIGMTQEQLGRIFTKFYTVRNPQKRGEGTGLGLAISDMIVRQLGGRIEVTSEVDTGSCFTVRLPLAPKMESPQLGVVSRAA